MRAIYDYIIYTDGGCERNPGGRGGYGAVIINNSTRKLTDISGGFRSTTNNRMEVMAVIKALEKIEKGTHIQLFSDSQYVIKTMNGMFRKKKNIDLWKKLDKLAVAFKIEWNWVKGHNGNTYNERCDTLCQEAMTLPELEEDVGYMNIDSIPEQSDTVAQSLEKYNIHYQNGELLENVIKKIRDDYNEKVQMAAVKIPNLQEFENVRGKIIYRLVNYEKNKELLEDCPHRRLYDLAVTFRWVAHIDNDGVSTSLITNRQVKEWGVSVNDLVLAAQQNTPRLFPAKIVDIEEMLAGKMSFILYLSTIPMYILTNEQEVNGASALLYGDVLKDFANKKGTDMYILPSSIHEVILLPSDRINDPTKLLSMVHDANTTVVSIGDVLSDSVYYYDRKTDHITEIVSDEKM